MKRFFPKILVAEDDETTLDLIKIHLENNSFSVLPVKDGKTAWSKLKTKPADFSAILLDRIMPQLNGLEVLEKIKNHEILKNIPVIFLTGKKEKEDLIEGLQAGAYYYLTKPYHKNTLITVVSKAVNSFKDYSILRSKLKSTADTMKLLKYGEFELQNLDEARNLAALLSNTVKDSSRIVIGLWEILINAVEHGNLNIGYSEKTELRKKGKWYEEIIKRLKLPENKNKKVRIKFEQNEKEVRFIIQDEGQGFDWQLYTDLDPERIFDMHGRGITMAKDFSFDRLEYHGKGNIVVAILNK